MVGLLVAAGVALGGPMPWTPWRLSPAPAASLRATVIPPPDLSFGTVEVDRFSGQLRYAIPLDPLPARPGASPALALTYQPMAQEGLGQGWSWALPSVQLSPDVSAGALRARKKNSPFTLGHVSGLHWNGYRLVYQGSMALSEIEALHSSAYHFQSNALVQMYAVDGSESSQQVWYVDEPLRFCDASCDTKGPREIASGFIVQKTDGSVDIYSGDTETAEGDFTRVVLGTAAGPETLPPFISRWPLAYQLFPGGATISYHYHKPTVPAGEPSASYLKSVAFAGGQSQYTFELCEMGTEMCPFTPLSDSFAQGHRLPRRHLYTKVQATFSNATRATWCFIYRGPRADAEASPGWGGDPACLAQLGSYAASPADTAAPVLDQVLRFGSSIHAESSRPTITFHYQEPRVSTRVLESHYPEGLGNLSGWEQSVLMDVNHDGYPDCLDADQYVHYHQGTPEPRFGPPEALLLTRDDRAYPLDLRDGRMQFADMDADGYTDVVELVEGAIPQLVYFPGSQGQGFGEARAINGAETLGALSGVEFKQGTALWMDMNGDGAADLLLVKDDGFTIVLNQLRFPGGGLSQASPDISVSTTDGSLRDQLLAKRVRFEDMNADGLPDLVIASPNQAGLCIYHNTGLNPLFRSEVLEGQGQLFVPADQLSAPCTQQNAALMELPHFEQPWFPGTLWFVDVSGDGLPDVVDVGNDHRTLRLWINQGRRFLPVKTIALDHDLILNESRSNVKIADIDGDGVHEMLVRESFDAHREVLAINFRRHDNDTRIEDGRLTGIQSSAGYFFKAQYASSRDEAQRDQRAGDATSPLPAPQVVVKRLLQGPGTLQEFRKEVLAIQEYYYSRAIYNTVDRAFGGFGLVKTLELGDATGTPPTHPAVIIEELFHGMSSDASGGSSTYLLGQPALTRTFSTQLSTSDLASRLESSTSVSVSTWSQHTPLPALGPERQRDTFTWSLQWTDATYTEQGNTAPWRFASRRLEQTNHQEFSDPLVESASLNETIRYAEFDRFNIPHCVHTERTAINVPTPQGTVEHIPPRQVKTCSEFDEARSTLKGWHILDQPARIHAEDLLAQQPLSTVTIQYHPRWGLPVQKTEKIYVDMSQVDAKMQGLFEYAAEQERSTYFTYDEFGNLVRIEDTTSHATSPATPVLQRMYDSTGLFLLVEKNAAQHETLYCYASLCAQQPTFPPGFSPEEHAGRVTHVRSPQGVWSFQAYDRLGRLQKVQTSTGLTRNYAYRYGSADRPSYTLVDLRGADNAPNPEAQPIASVLTAWDARGSTLFRVQERDETGSYLMDFASYNAQGDVIASHPGDFLPGIQPRELFAQDTFKAFQPHQVGLTTYAYDEEGRLTLVNQSNGYTRHYAHAPWGGRETEHILGSDGVTASTQRATVGVDDLVFAMIDQEGAVTRIRYDRFGNPAHILVPGEQQARTFVYNSQGELLFSAYPGLGMRKWTRNARGLAVAMTALNQAGDAVHHIESSFDPLGRVTRLQVDGKDDSLFIYDGGSSGNDSLPATGAVGHVVSMKRFHRDPRFVSTVSYKYNAESQIARQTTHIGERRFDDTFGYARDGQLQEVITTDHLSGSSLRTQYHRDAHGRVSGLAIGLPWKQDLEPFITRVGYDAYGAVNSLVFANGLHQEIASDPATFAINSIKTTQKAGAETHVMQDLGFKTNAKGIVEEIIDNSVQAITGPVVSHAARFAYNARGELQKTSRYGRSWEYQFNPNGIFTRNTELTAVPLQTVLGRPLHLAAPADFPLSYDALGQVEKAGDLEDAHYDAFGQLTEIRRGATTIQFGYAANGERLYKRVTAQQESITYYPSPRIHIESQGPEHYIFLGEQRLARVDAINKTWYLNLLDHLGSTDMTVDPKGTIAESFAYTSFGNTIDAQQAAPGTLGYTIAPTPYRFAGQYYDADTGLYVMGARYYQPRLGLFMSPDPLFMAAPRLSIDRPLEAGLYTYVGNDPVNYFDPSGLARTRTASRATPTRNNVRRQGTGQRRSPYYRGSWKHGRDLITQDPAYAGRKFESDHFPPNAAYRGTQYAVASSPGNRPAFPLEKEFHQFTKGTGGFGGHASSTGKTLVSWGANGYTQQLRGMMRNGDYYGAMKMDIIDKQNVGRMRLNDSTAFNSRMRPGVTNAFERGWITGTQFYDLMFNYLGSR